MNTTVQSNFHNPYKGSIKTARVIVDVDEADYLLIKTVRVTSGTITGVVGTLLQKLCNELRKQGITDYTKCDDFESFVANLIIADGRLRDLATSPTGGPATEVPGPNDGGRTAEVGGRTTGNAAIVPVIQGRHDANEGRTPGRRGGKGTKKG